MNLKNLTPHAVRIRLDGEARAEPLPYDLVIPPEPIQARVATHSVVVGHVLGIPVIVSVRGRIEDLPEPALGVAYIVLLIVLDALRAQGSTRRDVFAPATGPSDGAIRTKDGQIFAVTRLVGLGAP